VHCSAGKHRSGTIAALYRTRVQGWSKEKAWAEQQSYGFGTPEKHPELYDYVYGSRSQDIALNDAPSEGHSGPESEGKKHKSSKYSKDDGDHGYKDDGKSEGKKHKSSKSSKDDHDHGHKDDGKTDGHSKKKD
jgi:protein tyrosine/serine phosphatase